MMESAWYFPHNGQQLGVFYLTICVIYLLIHLIWERYSVRGPLFSLKNMHLKAALVFSSTTMASSLLFVVIVFDLENPLRYSDAFVLPLVISALCGIFVSLSSLNPEAGVR
ncbi:hypothetical protein SRABI13_01212 [Erwinia aphidicola]|uniref:hypothetical protein n=1 Tax=Erwinia aphidicola TaxID=68334 RepID=UPI001E00FD1B|nr:hypothetical protein [Erwinia aphidicola]CAH0179559.1 hypothetical protein SRABI13_01212 [Erwinia aphidicola]